MRSMQNNKQDNTTINATSENTGDLTPRFAAIDDRVMEQVPGIPEKNAPPSWETPSATSSWLSSTW